jgi:putative SOS response-associated peptidase YedK
MCGRFNLRRPASEIAQAFGFLFPSGLFANEPRFNILPTTQILAFRQNAGGQREGISLRWGLVPSWSKEISGPPLINARADTVASKPSFRSAFKRRRCLIPADGFYEWKTEGKTKTPFEITMSDESTFCLAGLWESWTSPDGSSIDSVAMITTEPNELMSLIHDRMPVILPTDLHGPWLDPAIDDAEVLQSMLGSFPAAQMKAAEVKKDISGIKFHDDPRLPASQMEFVTSSLAKRRSRELF